MGAWCSSCFRSEGQHVQESTARHSAVVEEMIKLESIISGKEATINKVHESTRSPKTTTEPSALTAISGLATARIREFDVFSVKWQCDEPLAAVGYVALRDVAKALELPLDTLSAFCAAVDQSMPPNDYHNKLHVADVLQLMLLQTLDDGPLSEICKDPILRLSLLLGAFVHDLKHPGVSNAFLRASNHELVQKYGPEAPAEKMHFSEFLTLVDDPAYDFLRPLTALDRDRVIDLVEEIVSSTDMSRHSEYVSMDEPSHPEHNVLFRLCFAMKVADLSHCFRKFKVHTKFTDMLKQEFYAQGDKEKALGLPRSHGMSRNELFQHIAQDQVNFLIFFIQPLLDRYAKISSAPLVKQIHDSLGKNIESWSMLAVHRNNGSKPEYIDGKMPLKRTALLQKSCSIPEAEDRRRQLIDIARIHSIEPSASEPIRRSTINCAAVNAISEKQAPLEPKKQSWSLSPGVSDRYMSLIPEGSSPSQVELDL